VVFGLSGTDQKVYRSANSMLSWNVTNIAVNATDAFLNFYPQPRNHSVLLALGNSNTGWRTSDGGLNWSSFQTVPVRNPMWNPKQPILVAMETSYGRPNGYLLTSNDMAATWTRTGARNVRGFIWCGFGEALCMIGDVDSNSASGGGAARFLLSRDYGKTFSIILDFVVQTFLYHNEFIFVLTTSAETGQAVLYASTDDGQTFNIGQLPNGLEIPYLEAEQVLAYHNDSVFLGVPAEGFNQNRVGGAPVYSSDGDGLKFVEVLDDVLTYHNWWDFDAIHSLEGAYLANVVENSDEVQEATGNQVKPVVTSYITWDNGGTWSTIPPPTGADCGNVSAANCKLNLFGITTWLGVGGAYYGQFYSDDHAVGLIVATGAVGAHLPMTGGAVGTFMSRDGGRNFWQIANTSTVYEYGDHGGILVMARNRVPITEISYTLDEGLNWNTLTFPARTIVYNIFTVSSRAKHVIVLASQGGNVVYYGIDFSQVHQNQCTESDYEMWTPADANSDCVLGRKVTYLRKKRDSTCYNDKYMTHIASSINCNCTAADYECDFGFERTLHSGVCVPVAPQNPAVCNADGKKVTSQGYRHLPGDTCVNDLPEFAPKIEDCGTPTPTGDHDKTSDKHDAHGTPGWAIGLIILVVIILVGVSLVAGVVLGARSERLRAMFPFLGRFSPRGHYDTQLPIDEMEEN